MMRCARGRRSAWPEIVSPCRIQRRTRGRLGSRRGSNRVWEGRSAGAAPLRLLLATVNIPRPNWVHGCATGGTNCTPNGLPAAPSWPNDVSAPRTPPHVAPPHCERCRVQVPLLASRSCNARHFVFAVRLWWCSVVLSRRASAQHVLPPHERVMAPLGMREAPASLSFSRSWQILGPFQIGTRGTAALHDPLTQRSPLTVPQKQRGELILSSTLEDFLRFITTPTRNTGALFPPMERLNGT